MATEGKSLSAVLRRLLRDGQWHAVSDVARAAAAQTHTPLPYVRDLIERRCKSHEYLRCGPDGARSAWTPRDLIRVRDDDEPRVYSSTSPGYR